MILPCVCSHQYQDSRYGEGKRLFNKTAGVGEGRCTVCARTTTKAVPAAKAAEPAKKK